VDEKRADLGLFILRLTGGLLAFKHGWGKLVRLAGGEGRFVQSVDALGFPTPEVFAWAAAIAEVSGILIVLGLLTRICAALAAFTTGVAAFLRHHAHDQLLAWLGWRDVAPDRLEEWGNPELALVHFFAFAAIVLLGPGRWSLDAAIRRRWRKRK
jgi:putative oxidoreductase